MAKGAPIRRLTQPGKPLRDSASTLMVRWNEMMGWADSIHDPRCVDELHALRIAAKRLRYTLELFEPAFGAAIGPFLRIAEQIQEQIGAIHDCDVLFPLLQDTLEQEMRRERRRAKKDQRDVGPPPFLAAEGLVALTTRKRTEREALYTDFLRFWDALPPEKVGADLARFVAPTDDKSHVDIEDTEDAT